MKLTGACATYIGNTRKVNQDAILFRYSERDGQHFAILAVCDGVGGLEKGEVASALVVRKINEWYDEVLRWLDIASAEPEVLNAHLKDGAELWNQAVCECRDIQRVNMGTTMSLLMIIKDRYFIIQVGDSRVYRYRNDVLEQLTVDASVSQMKNGRMKLYLDNFMGKARELWFTSAAGSLEDGDLFLVCSDGLYHCLGVEDVREIYRDALDNRKAEEACERLIVRMMERGERDNISAGIVLVRQKAAGRKKWWGGSGRM